MKLNGNQAEKDFKEDGMAHDAKYDINIKKNDDKTLTTDLANWMSLAILIRRVAVI